MIALDTNLLVYAHRSALPEHRKAKNAIEKAAASRGGWCIPSFCITEFWAVVTHPKCAGRPSLPEEASAFLSGLIDAGAKVLYPRDGFAERLTTCACELQIEGPRIFDLQIALVSYDGGAREIWTHDRSFCSLPGLPFKDPL
jgi:hypothetical protein